MQSILNFFNIDQESFKNEFRELEKKLDNKVQNFITAFSECSSDFEKRKLSFMSGYLLLRILDEKTRDEIKKLITHFNISEERFEEILSDLNDLHSKNPDRELEINEIIESFLETYNIGENEYYLLLILLGSSCANVIPIKKASAISKEEKEKLQFTSNTLKEKFKKGLSESMKAIISSTIFLSLSSDPEHAMCFNIKEIGKYFNESQKIEASEFFIKLLIGFFIKAGITESDPYFKDAPMLGMKIGLPVDKVIQICSDAAATHLMVESGYYELFEGLASLVDNENYNMQEMLFAVFSYSRGKDFRVIEKKEVNN